MGFTVLDLGRGVAIKELGFRVEGKGFRHIGKIHSNKCSWLRV